VLIYIDGPYGDLACLCLCWIEACFFFLWAFPTLYAFLDLALVDAESLTVGVEFNVVFGLS